MASRPTSGLQKNQEIKKDEIIAAAQQNTETTRRILRQTVETEAMAADTMRELSKQTEQLKDIDRKVDEIDNHITFSERTVRGMSSIFGAIKNVFTSGSYNPPPPSKPLPPTTASSHHPSSPASSSAPRHPIRPDASRPFDWQQQKRTDQAVGGAGRSQDDYKFVVQQEEQRQDNDLDMILRSVGNLKGMAQVIFSPCFIHRLRARSPPSAAHLRAAPAFTQGDARWFAQAMNGELATQSVITDHLDGKLQRCMTRQIFRTHCTLAASAFFATHPHTAPILTRGLTITPQSWGSDKAAEHIHKKDLANANKDINEQQR
jgi:hypothetical protein